MKLQQMTPSWTHSNVGNDLSFPSFSSLTPLFPHFSFLVPLCLPPSFHHSLTSSLYFYSLCRSVAVQFVSGSRLANESDCTLHKVAAFFFFCLPEMGCLLKLSGFSTYRRGFIPSLPFAFNVGYLALHLNSLYLSELLTVKASFLASAGLPQKEKHFSAW